MTRRPQTPRGARVGFTLVEVMVAIAILAIALTAIFANQAGSVRTAHHARKTTLATILARCKMNELEEELAREGLPAVESLGTDECCEGGEIEGFSCEWAVQRVPFPDLEEEGEGLGGADEGASAEGSSGFAGASSVDDILAGTAPTSGGDMIGELALSYAWPVLQPALEEQVRRVRVTVRWTIGGSGSGSGPCEADERNRCFDVVQYVAAAPGPPAATEGGDI